MEDFKEAMMEFMKIQFERLYQELYKKQNKRLEKNVV